MTYWETETSKVKWWGEHHFELNRPNHGSLARLLFRLTRGLQEWRMEYHRPSVQFDYGQRSGIVLMILSLPDFLHLCILNVICLKIRMKKFKSSPRLANRSRTLSALSIRSYTPAGQRGTLYISTPLWVAGFVEGQRALRLTSP